MRLKPITIEFGLCVAIIGIALSCAAPLHATPSVEPPLNARDDFARAGAALVDRDKIGTDLTLAEKQKLVARNARALQLARVGFAHRYRDTSSYAEAQAATVAFDFSSKMRALARLFVAEGKVYEARDDWNRAANSFLDAIKLGQEMPRGASLLGSMTGYVLESIGKYALWQSVEKLDARAARMAARRLESLEAKRHPFADTLRAEWKIGEGEVRQEARRVKHSIWTQSRAVAEHRDFMAAQIMDAMRPYTLAQQKPQSNEPMAGWEEYEKAAQSNSPDMIPLLLRMSKNSIDMTRFQIEKTRAQNALLLTSLALRAHKLERGNYPAALNELVPTYLSRVPADPFALQAPLRYKRRDETYSLYSIGPDGKDNEGAPIGDAKTRNVQADSKGDIVAGVNLR